MDIDKFSKDVGNTSKLENTTLKIVHNYGKSYYTSPLMTWLVTPEAI
jgi:hypothetical protein